ncbi:IS4 transposase [Halapricum desulfuricans]|uniref:IS4 transposase n=1 Tax=Halapricum desulfuricans TaxID=2841257 RepID=A0A897N8R7_9EURY|nr:IS4 transposase [Halapricum desulfuricans]
MDVFNIPDPDEYLSASDVKDVAEEVIAPLPLPGVEGSPLDSGDIWLVVILACVNQNSIWDTCNDTNGTPCDDTVHRVRDGIEELFDAVDGVILYVN